jgi:hypothetical protein
MLMFTNLLDGFMKRFTSTKETYTTIMLRGGWIDVGFGVVVNRGSSDDFCDGTERIPFIHTYEARSVQSGKTSLQHHLKESKVEVSYSNTSLFSFTARIPLYSVLIKQDGKAQ